MHLTSNVVGTTFSWVATFPPQISGASSGSGDSIYQTLVNIDSIPHSVSYSISTSGNGCPGQNTNITVLVNPSPQISFSIPNQSICSSSTSQQVIVLSSTSGVAFSWVATVPVAVSGATLSGSNTIPAQLLTNSSNTLQTVDYVVSCNFHGCSGPQNQYGIAIKPTPHVTNTDTLLSVCSHDTLAEIILLSDVAGASFSWSGSGPASASGYILSGNSNTIPLQVISNSSNVPDTIAFLITPMANNCPGPSRIFKVIVRPLPQITLSPDSQTLCSGGNSIPVNILSTVQNTSNIWSGTAVNITGAILNGSTSSIPAMYLTNNSPIGDTGIILYSIQPLASGCPGIIASAYIRVDPKPIPGFVLAQSVLCSPSPVSIAANGLVFGHPDSLTVQWGDGATLVIHPNPIQPIWNNATHFFSNTGFIPDTFKITLTAHNHCGDSSTSQQVIVYPNTINAFFTSSISQGCAPLAVTFTDFSSGGTTASWCFEYDTVSHTCTGAGQVVAPHSTVNHTFAAGNHIVALFINDGCSFDTVFQIIRVNAGTIANFDFIDNICKGSVVQFQDSSSIAAGTFVMGYNWHFGDGDSSSLTSPTHAYDTAGILQVCLSISSSAGCSSTLCKPIHILPVPIAAFSDTNICVNSQPALFQNHSQGALFNLWNFGDGNTDNNPNPSHVFIDSGHYVVTLIASTNQCADTVTGNIIIYPKPHADFSLPAPYSCGLPSQIQISDQSTGASGYIWTLGNGGSSTNINPVAVYNTAGSYNISLIASNIYHCYDTMSKPVDIYPYPKISSIDVNPAEGCQPLTVTFTANATNALSYNWDFGDRVNILLQTVNQVSYTYADTGRFSITVSAYSYSACGDTVLLSDTVTVHVRPTANFEFTQDSTGYPVDGTISFTNTSTNATHYMWDFGDGSMSLDTSPRHRFEVVSSFDVMLTAITDYGCRDTAIKVVTVLKKALYVPNALAPDYGGFDTLVKIWKPIGIGLRDYHAQVFDKWGKLLWQSDLLDHTIPVDGWDGTYLGVPCAQDVYVWKVDAVFIDGEIWPGMTYQKDEGGGTKRIGSITLIR